MVPVNVEETNGRSLTLATALINIDPLPCFSIVNDNGATIQFSHRLYLRMIPFFPRFSHPFQVSIKIFFRNKLSKLIPV